MNTTLHTPYGTAKLKKHGYYQITSIKEGNGGKLLHRLIWEDFYKKPIPKGYDIHHVDGNSTNNKINNLQCVFSKLHQRFHKKNRKVSDETCRKISEINKGKKETLQHKLNISKASNTSGYFRVYKKKDNTCTQKFRWIYSYHDENTNRKEISSVDMDKLEQKVKEKGLEWFKLQGDEKQ